MTHYMNLASLPFEQIKSRAKNKGKYQKDLEAKKSEVNTLKRYNIIMVFSADNSRILFCKRKKPPYIGKLNFPGGKWEEGKALLRRLIGN